MDCLFCDIANGKTDTEIVYENDNFAVFNDIKPKAPIHLLIVPKIHIESLNEASEEKKELLVEMILLTKKMAEKFNVEDGYRIQINTGKKSGQEIDHLHLHLLGFK
jgi:histidine triad (HIT) family protein